MGIGASLAVIFVSFAHLEQRVCLLEVQDRTTDQAIIAHVHLHVHVPPQPQC